MAKRKPIGTALIGSGEISEIYLKNLCGTFQIIDLVGCSDIVAERSHSRADAFNIRQMTNEQILNDPYIKIVVNTTYPLAHYDVTKAALEAGKNVYSEKMLAVSWSEGRELVDLARKKSLYFTVAPDTFMGAGLQTARWVIDSGMIGNPICVVGVCQRGYHLTRPTEYPGMVHLPGGGIPFDMGGYYLHAFINMFGPITRVAGFAKTLNPDKKFLNTANPLYGETFHVDTPNTMAASLEFASGVYGTLTMTSESVPGMQKIDVIGTEGQLSIHDPDYFSGPIVVKNHNSPEPSAVPFTHGFAENSRGIGVADMAYAMVNERLPRADAAMGLHAFEVIHKVLESSATGSAHSLETTVVRPKAIRKNTLNGYSGESILDD